MSHSRDTNAIYLDRSASGARLPHRQSGDLLKTALEVQPGCVVAMQGAAELAVRAGKNEAALAGWLKEIAMSGESEAWREWAVREGASRK